MLLFADNLDAHCHLPVLEKFAQANIFVWFVVPGCTDLIQPIDAGIGRSIRIYVGHALDRWLSIDDNLDLWEGKLKASERRVMMTNFLASAMDKILSEEKKSVRIGSFRRTGCLIELHNRELAQPDRNTKFSDDYIKPQGIVGKYIIPLRIGLGMGKNAAEADLTEERETPEAIDAIVNEEKNYFLGGEGENEELDDLQDFIEEYQGALEPDGLDIE